MGLIKSPFWAKVHRLIDLGRSSNGRTYPSGGYYLGSSPSLPAMKKIALILAAFILMILGLFLIFKIPFDKNFIANILNGLLSNFLILFVAIFVIDNLTKDIETRKLKDINKRASDFVSFRINVLVLRILKYLKVLEEEEDVEISLKKNKELNFDYVWEELAQKTNGKNFNQILYDATFSEINKKEYLTKLSEIIMEGGKSISQALKNVYPHPAPDVINLIDELSSQSGAINAMSLMADVDEEVNKIIPESSKKMDKKMADILLKVMILDLDTEKEVISVVFSSLSKLSDRAKNNDLFTS